MAKKILVVDDQADVRRMMKILLEQYGYEVIEAADGYEAVEAAVEHFPDLIFMDIAMPVLDGIQATTAIRQHAQLDGVPIVAVTAYGEHYQERANQAGFNQIIQKPLNFEKLRPLCKQLIN